MTAIRLLGQAWLVLVFIIFETVGREIGEPFGMISKVQSACEVEALAVGSKLADYYNSYDEETEWDARVHHDYLVQNLGFAGWIQTGTWGSKGITAEKNHAPTLHRVSHQRIVPRLKRS
jgi:hypothetical protein